MRIKRIFPFLFLWGSSLFLHAQSIVTVHGFNAGARTENNTYVGLGEPFYNQTTQNGYELSCAVAQAQLVYTEISASVPYGVGYDGNGFSFPATTSLGTHTAENYSHDGPYNYDKLTKLFLTVVCPLSVQDADGNPYSTVMLDGNCWTRENLRTEHYVGSVPSPIEKALVYRTEMYPNETGNEDIYGRLYTFYSAVNLPEGSNATPPADANGRVRGICPENWHIPTVEEMRSLEIYEALSLRSQDYWLEPGTNTTFLSLLPAGLYNGAARRFENLRGNTYLWTCTPLSTGSNTKAYIGHSFCRCEQFLIEGCETPHALSVRCVMDK